MTEPTLHVRAPDHTRGVVVLLHGGRPRSTASTTERQLAVARMRPIESRLTHDGQRSGLAVARLRYQVRGWNAPDQSPVADARWALDRLRHRFPSAPVCLVGHSMGGRVINHVADDPAVTGAVELAPWIEPEDPVGPLTGVNLLVVHGTRDRTTSGRRSAELVDRVQGIARSARFVALRGSGHALLGRSRLSNHLVSGFVLRELLGIESAGPVRDVLNGDARHALV